ncbi:hypothetical protein R0131_12565 [Clostridium sp. AL.422]|uniref:hypothetical protein n=1 Tax=Clostridium TaxID=1485 RepID=UPI00293DABF1|nr:MULTISPECIES: hypothetical protein [unclassified Clostridium]MDV4151658.1 hypothetical protein [Clostridium sp. AL.422]
MNDREVFKELNGINYKDEEVKEYIDFANIDDKKLSSITNDIRTNLAKEKLSEAFIHVKEKILERDEVIEKIIKGTDPDMLNVATGVNLMINTPFITGDGYSFNVLMFCTNKRIILVNANYYNRMQGVKIYNKEEIKEMIVGADVKKKYRFKFQLDYKRSKIGSIGNVLFLLFMAYLLSTVLSMFAYMLANKSELIKSIVYFISMIPIAYFFLTRRRLESELLIEFSNGKFKDLLIRNTDCDEIQEYLSNKYK